MLSSATADPLTAVVSHAFWTTRLGGDRNALGQTLKYGQQLYTIVGILPPSFRFPRRHRRLGHRGGPCRDDVAIGHNYRAVGRLKPA
jgi:hypothetical protein